MGGQEGPSQAVAAAAARTSFARIIEGSLFLSAKNGRDEEHGGEDMGGTEVAAAAAAEDMVDISPGRSILLKDQQLAQFQALQRRREQLTPTLLEVTFEVATAGGGQYSRSEEVHKVGVVRGQIFFPFLSLVKVKLKFIFACTVTLPGNGLKPLFYAEKRQKRNKKVQNVSSRPTNKQVKDVTSFLVLFFNVFSLKRRFQVFLNVFVQYCTKKYVLKIRFSASGQNDANCLSKMAPLSRRAG